MLQSFFIKVMFQNIVSCVVVVTITNLKKCILFIFRFQAAIKKYGVPEEEIFQTADLFERRNIPQVTLCLYALGRIVSIFLTLDVLCGSFLQSFIFCPSFPDSKAPRMDWSSARTQDGGKERTYLHWGATSRSREWTEPPDGLQQGSVSVRSRRFRQHPSHVNHQHLNATFLHACQWDQPNYSVWNSIFMYVKWRSKLHDLYSLLSQCLQCLTTSKIVW